MRVVIAFLIAPISPAFLVLVLNLLHDDIVYWEFILGLGAIIGYGVAGFVGIPSYLMFFRDLQETKSLPVFYFWVFISSLYWLIFGAYWVANLGLLGGLTNPSFWGYGVIFSIATAVAVFVFYIIAFHKFQKQLT